MAKNKENIKHIINYNLTIKHVITTVIRATFSECFKIIYSEVFHIELSRISQYTWQKHYSHVTYIFRLFHGYV